MDDDRITAGRAAQELGVSVIRVYQLIEEDILDGVKEMGQWLVTKESVKQRMESMKALEKAKSQV